MHRQHLHTFGFAVSHGTSLTRSLSSLFALRQVWFFPPQISVAVHGPVCQRSSVCGTTGLWLCAWIQDGPMLTPGLQLYNCPACSMQGKWLNKRRDRVCATTSSTTPTPTTPPHPHPHFGPLLSASQNLYFRGMSAAGMWRILNKSDEKVTYIIHVTFGHGWPLRTPHPLSTKRVKVFPKCRRNSSNFSRSLSSTEWVMI